MEMDGHSLRKPATNITGLFLECNPQDLGGKKTEHVMEEDYNTGVQELGEAMESSEIDCTKPDLTESRSGGPILQLKWT